MRLYETFKFRRQRKHLIKRLKQNLQNEEKYVYYLSKLQTLYHSYKKYPDNVIQQKYELYLKANCLKTAKFYYQEKLSKELAEYKSQIDKKVDIMIREFKKLKGENDKKMGVLNHKITRKSGKDKFRIS